MSNFIICNDVENYSDSLLSILLEYDSTKPIVEEHVMEFLKEKIDWKLVFSAVASWQDDFNDLAGRFMKAELIAEVLQISTSNRMVYIDEKGCDLFIPELNTRIELKTFKDTLFNSREDKTKEIKVKNTQGNKVGYDLEMKKTFDYMLILSPGLAVVTKYKNVQEKCYGKGDGLYVVLDYNDLNIIKKSNSFTQTKIPITDIKKRILQEAIVQLKNVMSYE